ncbi:GntR family transcriptional regulator [Halarsenatibacter silvermanii]|uniref:DNA-binding transcriptional regulator, GntR family n=1 Tax=Halarsenatibacter silvermanii TaxID=321763 RepID=A0A1G9SES2_9FIRM|nr:GntR family transcriptional regulator [Halarsenatibacter silvermanii]SDM33807.1 DNA-binding transcriptional regulator, GntR family [Halarsenatibacter silvermanii]
MIETKSISEQITEILKKKVLRHEFTPGEKIDTDMLAQKFDVSAMPVRDALKKLENRGLVTNRERVGFFVRKFELDEIREIIEVRIMYEGYCLEKHLNNIDFQALEKLYEDMKNFNNANRNEFDNIDKSFHNLIIEASQNNILIERYRNIEDLIDLVRHLDREREKDAMSEHIKVTEKILNKEPEKAKSSLEEHIINVRDGIIGGYEEL